MLIGLSSIGDADQELTTQWHIGNLEEIDLKLFLEPTVSTSGMQARGPIQARAWEATPELEVGRPKRTIDRRIMVSATVVLLLLVAIVLPRALREKDDSASASGVAPTLLIGSKAGSSSGGRASAGGGEGDAALLELTPKQLRETQATMTRDEWAQYTETLIGKRVEWTGRVVEAYLSGEVILNVDPRGDPLSTVTARITLPVEDLDYVAIEKKLTFRGDIGQIKEYMGPLVIFGQATLVD